MFSPDLDDLSRKTERTYGKAVDLLKSPVSNSVLPFSKICTCQGAVMF